MAWGLFRAVDTVDEDRVRMDFTFCNGTGRRADNKKEIFHASAVENLLGMDNELIEWLHWKDPFHTVEVVTSRNVGVRPSPRRR